MNEVLRSDANKSESDKELEHAVKAYRELQKSPAVQAIKSLWVDLRDENATPATKELKAAVDAHPDPGDFLPPFLSS
jgi:hypothetical protein